MHAVVRAKLAVALVVVLHTQLPSTAEPLHQNDVCTSSRPGAPLYWLANTDTDHLAHVKDAFARLGWGAATSPEENWSVMWAFHNPFVARPGEPNTVAALADLRPGQIVNQLPGASWFTSKVELVKASKRLDFLPVSYELPSEYGDFQAAAAADPQLEWVRKGSSHRSVSAVAADDPALAAIAGGRDEGSTFVQQLVRPYLIDDKLWDVGLYVAVTSVDPLRIYVFDNVLLRHCSANYTWDLLSARPQSYVVAENYDPPWTLASLRPYYTRGFSTLNVIRAFMHDQGLNFDDILDEMKADVVRLIHHHAPALAAAAARYPLGSRSFFALYRADFLVDQALKPWLIEVNQSPNLSSASTHDLKSMFQRISYSLLSLMGLGPGQLRNPAKVAEEADTVTHHTDVDIGARVCSGACEDSCNGDCVICRRCRTDDDTRALMETVSESRNKQAFLRLYPLDARMAERSDLRDVAPQTAADRLLHIWLRERCLQDQSWC